MKIVTSSNGKKTVKISKREWESLGKKAGWTKTADIDELYKKYDMTKQKKPVYVSLYETSRNYGGAEEGGWYYTHYELKSSKKFYDIEEANAFASRLQDEIDGKGLNDGDMGSSKGFENYPDPSGGDPMYDHSDNDIPLGWAGDVSNYDVIVEDEQGENQTKGRPYYE
jgi:hypothetical protein